MRVLAMVVLLVGCVDAPYCFDPSLGAGSPVDCSEGSVALCAGGFDPDNPGFYLPGTEYAQCDADGVPFCENGAEPWCEPQPED